MQSKKPNPVAFAQTIIHELAQIRATIQHLSEISLDDISNRHNRSDAEKAALRNQFKSYVDDKAAKFYQLYAREIGIEDQSKQGDQDEPNRPIL